METDDDHHKAGFDPTFNWGHIATIGAVIITGFASWSAISSDLRSVKEFKTKYEPIIDTLVREALIDKTRLERCIDECDKMKNSIDALWIAVNRLQNDDRQPRTIPGPR